MTDHRKPKRYKNILSWFAIETPPSGSGSCSGSKNGSKHVTENSVNDVLVDSSPSIPVVEECNNERTERVEMVDITSLERDPGIRKSICLYPLNDHDNIRRAYVVLGPYQPKLSSYPSTILCQSLQKKAIYILNALNFLSITKSKLQDMRDGGWDSLIIKVASFCSKFNITMSNMSAPYKKRIRACEQGITNEHYYRVYMLKSVIDFQLAELDSRFTDGSLELLVLSATFDPQDDFAAFKSEDVCTLALKYYPGDFTPSELLSLNMECGYFLTNIQRDPRFAKTASLSVLCRRLVESRKLAFFPMIYRLICLVLILSVSTATTERAFSSMNIIKNHLRNKMEDDFFDDLMVLYIEKEFANNIDNDSVIDEFEKSGPRRVRFS